MHPRSSDGIIRAVPYFYLIRGVLPIDSLRDERMSRGHQLESETTVFASPEDFQGLELDYFKDL